MLDPNIANKFRSLFHLQEGNRKNRLTALFFIVILLYIVLVIRIIVVSVSGIPANKVVKSNVSRRDIVDRNGKLLATNIMVVSIAIRPEKILDKAQAFDLLMEALPELNAKVLWAQLHSNKTFVWLKRGIEPSLAKEIHDMGIEGVELEHEYRRLYPHKTLVSHIVGYTGIDNNGLAGAELYFEDFLSNANTDILSPKIKDTNQNLNIDENLGHGEDESLEKYTSAFNIGDDESQPNTPGGIEPNNVGYVPKPTFRPELPISDELSNQASQHNNQLHSLHDQYSFTNDLKPLELSIDLDIQYVVSEEIASAMEEFRAIKATCIVVDPNNGEVLAAVNKPDFDPHKIQDRDSLFPTAWYGLYEVGSVFKSIIFAIALDTHNAALNDVYDIRKFNIGKFTVKDYHYHEGRQTLPQIFINSSNIGLAMVALSMDQQIIRNYFERLGIFSPLKLEMPEKVMPGYLKHKWEPLTICTMSYGYGISMTPAHFTQAMVPVVNGGIAYPLTVLKSQNSTGKRVFSKQTSTAINRLLRLVVTEAKLNAVNVPGMVVGGKTGTAHKLKNKKYDDKTRVSSFIAVSPAHKPKYLIYFLIDEPKGNKSTYGFATARFTAAPVVGKILSRIAVIKGENLYDHTVDEELFFEYKLSK